MKGLKSWRAVLTALSIATFVLNAQAQEENDDEPNDPDTGESTIVERRLGLLPPQRRGVKFDATYIGEGLGNPSGGFKQGGVYEGRLNLSLEVDLGKAQILDGASFHVNAFQIHGRGLSRENVGNLITLSGIEALATTRLYEIWFEQKWGQERYSIRAGQMAADSEFLNSKYTDIFTNTSFGWPTILSVDLPAGGPSPPLAVMGIRGRAKLSENVTVLAAAFDGNSAGPGPEDPQVRNRYGVNFRVNDPPFVIGEVQYAYALGSGQKDRPGTIKLGGWYHAGDFDDQRFGPDGRSLADPFSIGAPRQLTSNYGVYGVVEQLIVPSAKNSDKGIAAFARVFSAPPDRNLIDFYADSGVQVSGFSQARPNDKFGFAFAYANISKQARGVDGDYQAFGVGRDIRSYEALFTGTYLIDVRDGLQLIPNIQYVMHPGGGLVNAADPSQAKRVPDATVFGLRTVVKF